MSPAAPLAPRPPALFAGVEPLEMFAALLAEIDADAEFAGAHPGRPGFYDRICEAICRLTTMRRAAIFMADSAGREVRVVGTHGTPRHQLAELRPTLDATPIAQVALESDQVVVVSEAIERWVQPDYARVLGITTLVCTPMSAAGRGYGVVCADRGGGRFELSDGERHLLWTLGKTAGLVTTARHATRQQERSRRLADRLGLAREIHERVLQRLFGVSLALGASQALSDGERERCRTELQEAVGELRRALERPLAPVPRETTATLSDELVRHAAALAVPLRVDWPEGVTVPPELEPLAQSVLAEALRNAVKHARPDAIDLAVARDADTFVLEVINGGVPARGGGAAGMGLRLAAFEALGQGGMVEFGGLPGDRWRVRLVVPVEGP